MFCQSSSSGPAGRCGGQAGEPWTRTGDRATWRAVINGLLLTVTGLAGGGWQALAEGEGAAAGRSPVLPSRAAAQRWAEAHAGDGPLPTGAGAPHPVYSCASCGSMSSAAGACPCGGTRS